MMMTSNGRRPQNIKRGISMQPLYGLEENSEEISSVALLSPACCLFLLMAPEHLKPLQSTEILNSSKNNIVWPCLNHYALHLPID